MCNMFWDENVEAQERRRQGIPPAADDYDYDMDLEALLELGVLIEVERGLFEAASRSNCNDRAMVTIGLWLSLTARRYQL